MKDINDRNVLFTAYVYMKTRNWDPVKAGGRMSNTRVDVGQTKLKISDVFSPSVAHFVMNKPIDIGHVDALRVPGKIVQEGLKMEKFMQPLQSIDREVESENFLNEYSKSIQGLLLEDDSWLLNLVFLFEEREILEQRDSGVAFYTQLNHEYAVLVNSFGMIDENKRVSIGMDNLRKHISRDPALRNVLSPNDILRTFERYDIREITDYPEGKCLLKCMGMEENVASTVLDAIFNDMYGSYPSSTLGALTDDFSSTLRLVHDGYIKDGSFPDRLQMNHKIHCLIHASQMSIFKICVWQKSSILKSVRVRNEKEEIVFSTMPLSSAIMASAKEKIRVERLSSAVVADILNAHEINIISSSNIRHDGTIVDKEEEEKIRAVIIPPLCGKTELTRVMPTMVRDVEDLWKLRDSISINCNNNNEWLQKLYGLSSKYIRYECGSKLDVILISSKEIVRDALNVNIIAMCVPREDLFNKIGAKARTDPIDMLDRMNINSNFTYCRENQIPVFSFKTWSDLQTIMFKLVRNRRINDIKELPDYLGTKSLNDHNRSAKRGDKEVMRRRNGGKQADSKVVKNYTSGSTLKNDSERQRKKKNNGEEEQYRRHKPEHESDW